MLCGNIYEQGEQQNRQEVCFKRVCSRASSETMISHNVFIKELPTKYTIQKNLIHLVHIKPN